MSTNAPVSDVGLIGLAVMGENLALNIARHGFAISVYNRTSDLVDRFESRLAGEAPAADGRAPRVSTFRELEAFVRSLARPRRIVVLVRAGEAVDWVLDSLLPLLEDGDLVVDGGNSHPDDTERRAETFAARPGGRDVHFMGMGVSGGEEGALNGPSLMPGGPVPAWEAMRPILEKIAARVDDGPCVTHLGPGSAGHFVKTVHNGIEYGDMQLIAEVYDVLRHVGGLAPPAIGDLFAEWDRGPMQSFLTEITARILRETDPETGQPMVDVIVDEAGQKGTGRWTCELALRHGVPIPTIQAAVSARGLSAMRDQRVAASKLLRGPDPRPDEVPATLAADLHEALYASKICCYAQGLELIRTVSDEKDWGVDLAETARIWKGGCIIRARLLERIQAAFPKSAEGRSTNLLLDPELRAAVDRGQAAWRRVVATAATAGVPVLAMASSLAYFDSLRRERLPQDLTQAQRDLFGAHTFERVDRPAGETFHHDWG